VCNNAGAQNNGLKPDDITGESYLAERGMRLETSRGKSASQVAASPLYSVRHPHFGDESRPFDSDFSGFNDEDFSGRGNPYNAGRLKALQCFLHSGLKHGVLMLATFSDQLID
jgi:hypothetical protein